MPRPSSTISRPDLGAIAFEHLIDAPNRGFIGLGILPIFETMEQSAEYPVIPTEAMLKVNDTKRAPRGNYSRDDFQFSVGTYSCKDCGHEEPVDDVEAKLYARYFDAEEVSTLRAVDKVLRAQEIRIAGKLFNPSNFTPADVTTEWSTVATATPVTDVKDAILTFRRASGLIPNVGVCTFEVFMRLTQSKQINDNLQYTTPLNSMGMDAQRAIIATMFGLEDVLVGGAVKDSAGKGKATVIADVWDDEYFGLFKVTRNPKDLRDPSIGRTFLWTEDSPENTVVESYREEQSRSDIIRVRHNVDECFVYTGAGMLMGNISA